jgi:PAS domain S-box-containing protein
MRPTIDPHAARRIPFWAALALVAGANLALTQLGLALAPTGSLVAAFWPASGLMLGALLLSSPRRWPWLLLAGAIPTATFNLVAGRPLDLVAAFAAGNAVETLLGAVLARRLCGGKPDLVRVGHVVALTAAGPLVASVAASAFVAVVLSRTLGGSFGITWFHLWIGSALGSIAVAPALLAWAEMPHPVHLSRSLVLEIVALAAAFVGIAWIVFGPSTQVIAPPLALFLPVLLWPALRFGLRGASAVGLPLAVIVLGAMGHGLGLFVTGSIIRGRVSGQLHCAVTLFSVLGMASVVESRRRDAEALRRSQQKLRLVRFATDAVTDPLACLDPGGTVVYVNDVLCGLLRRERKDILGQPIWSVAPSVDPERWKRHWEEVKRLGTVTAELPATEIERHTVPFEIRSSYLSFDGQEFCVSTARDLRDRRKAEAALRLASIGTMAAGMAHEINNPLAYVIGNLEWIREQVRAAREAGGGGDGATRAAAALEAIDPVMAETLEGAGRIRDVVQDLKLFSRADDGDGRSTPADVVRALRGALTLAHHELRHRARLVQEYDEVPPVPGDEHRLGQVFLNLILNAAQAIPEGHRAENLVRVAARRVDGEVLVEVEDTGCGMSSEVQARIFDPFFTTKPVGFGTGLGLSICHGIVASAGGRIEVSSRPGHGSLFRVRLPATADPVDAAGASPPAPGGARRPCRILVVDDDDGICRVLQRALPEHDVEGCTSAGAALERIAAERFEVVVCDLVMPEMTGMEFHERLALSHPDLARRTLFVTAGAFTPAARAFLERTDNPHLEKPFATSALRHAIESLCGRERASPDRRE